MKRIHAILTYFRIESDGELSLTTVAFAVALYLLIVGRPISLSDLGAFAIVVAAHRVRAAGRGALPPAPEVPPAVEVEPWPEPAPPEGAR